MAGIVDLMKKQHSNDEFEDDANNNNNENGLMIQQEKENIDLNLLDFTVMYNNHVKKEPSLKPQENEIVVDSTSLSSWLVESSQDDDNNNNDMPSSILQVGSGESSQDDTPNSKNSVGSVGNSPSGRTIKFDI
ncbi:hypothetical protein RND71_012110 [Anisodus tanguticus]|uniref:Uncharacterized protein n=1 Tax=Anisodus tanguticus TaxID=243964 RepID=A0AAE1VFN6_9SOLA|nr:hypothetical protein RND71_012110 [Anisodus tanguticus]